MGESYSTSTNGQHKERSTTPRNQQHKTLLEMTPFLIGLGTKRMVGTTNIHLVRILDTRITIEDC